MTKAQRTLLEVQGRQSELRSRLAVLAAQDTRSADEETELTAVETKLSGCEPELRAALSAAAAEDDASRSTVPTTDPENRERLELRGKNWSWLISSEGGGCGRCGGRRCGSRVCGRVRCPDRGARADGDFCAHSAHSRDAGHYSGASREGCMLQPTVPFVFERSAAASLGILMPSVPSMGQVQIPKITTAPPSRHAGEGWLGSGDGCGGHAGQSGSRPHRGPVRGPC